MRWEGGRRSENVEDDRGGGGGFGFPGGGGGFRIPIGGGGGIGIVGMLAIGALCLFLGIDPRDLLQGDPYGQPAGYDTRPAPQASSPADDKLKDFVSVVLADTEDTWTAIFRQAGARYQDPKLVLFTGSTRSACGAAAAAVGPFYCGADQKVYLDLSFFRDLSSRFGAPGDFARAYVIAHEIGHHVQNLTGILEKVNERRARAGGAQANALSVRLELQADCFAGIWAYNADKSRHILEPGDIEEGLRAAAAVGDDRLQQQSRGYVAPDSFTHGSSAQRTRWFKRGFENGSMRSCDTFADDRI